MKAINWLDWIETEWISRPSPAPRGRWVTLYTDANPLAWAMHARANAALPREVGLGVVTEAGGVFGKRVDTTFAEAMAIVHGVRAVRRTWPEAQGIGVHSDSRPAMRVLRSSRGHERDDLREAQGWLRQATHGVRVRFRWVRGHSGKNTPAAWLNARVDRRAAAACGKAEWQ